jgi:DNA-binding transcriptional LysR family regulator
MRNLNLDQLHALAEVVALGSFSAAARRLNLSQPAVSLQIRELETRLGVRLIDRIGKRAFATAVGQDVVAHAQRLMDEAERTLATARRHREGALGRVTVGAGYTSLVHLLPPVIRSLRERHPGLELVVTTGTTTRVIELMQENRVELGIVTLPVDPRAFRITPLREGQMFAVFPASYPVIPSRATPAFLADHPVVLELGRAHHTRASRGWFADAGIDVRPVMELDNAEAVKMVVAAGLGVSVLPEEEVEGAAARPDIVARPLDPPLTRTLVLIERHDRPDNPALAIVRSAMLSLARPARSQPTRKHAQGKTRRR